MAMLNLLTFNLLTLSPAHGKNGCNNYTTLESHAPRPHAMLLRHDDRADLADGLVQVVLAVDHHVVELVERLHLGLRHLQAPLHLVGRLGAAPLQAVAQLGEAAGRQEDEHRAGRQPLDRRRALHVDAQDDVAPALQRLPHLALRDALVVSVHLGPLQQLLACDHLLEALLGHKMVVVAAALARPHRPAGGGDDKVEREAEVAHAHQNRVLADAGRTREHDQQRLRRLAVEQRVAVIFLHVAPGWYNHRLVWPFTVDLWWDGWWGRGCSPAPTTHPTTDCEVWRGRPSNPMLLFQSSAAFKCLNV